MSKSSGFAPTPQQGMSRPGSPGLIFDKDEDRQGLMMDTLGERRPGDREREIKEAGIPAQTAAQEQSEFVSSHSSGSLYSAY
jgi:hypothetical protein